MVGKNLKNLRNKKGLSQKDLAEQLNVSPQAISRWENEEVEPDISTLNKLSKLFEVTIDDLLNTDLSTKDVVTTDNTVDEVVEEPKKEEKPVEKPAKKQAKKTNNNNKTYNPGIVRLILGCVIGIVLGIITYFVLTKYGPFPTAGNIGFTVLAVYGGASLFYCLTTESYILDVFEEVAGISIKFPALIFSFDLDGLAFLIIFKVIFAIIGFLAGLVCAIFAIALCMLLSIVSFPFILVHNIRHGLD